jgi:1-acyl-sn-glycerol-3-phosphate acyltransferase
LEIATSFVRALKNMLRATFVYLFVGLYILILAPFGMLWAYVSRNGAILYSLARICIRVAGGVSGVRVNVQGREKIAPGMTYVFLSNHQGNFDAPVLIHVIPRNTSVLIKREMMRIPVLSLVLKQVDFIPLDRLNPKKAQIGIERGAQLLANGKSFLAFPEGTRSRDGKLGDFKKGVFVMAIKAQAPIIPITLRNSAQVNPPGTYGVRAGCIDVVIHDPIETKGMTLEDRNRLVETTREAIASAL